MCPMSAAQFLSQEWGFSVSSLSWSYRMCTRLPDPCIPCNTDYKTSATEPDDARSGSCESSARRRRRDSSSTGHLFAIAPQGGECYHARDCPNLQGAAGLRILRPCPVMLSPQMILQQCLVLMSFLANVNLITRSLPAPLTM